MGYVGMLEPAFFVKGQRGGTCVCLFANPSHNPRHIPAERATNLWALISDNLCCVTAASVWTARAPLDGPAYLVREWSGARLLRINERRGKFIRVVSAANLLEVIIDECGVARRRALFGYFSKKLWIVGFLE